jgi:glutaminyl-tRNA synthetase
MKIGVTMAQTVLSPTLLEACVRDVLNVTAPRVMAVLDPLKVTIRNYPFDKPVVLDVLNFPNDENKGSHSVAFDKTIYIDACDFKEVSLTMAHHLQSTYN